MIVDHSVIVAVNVVIAALFVPLLIVGTVVTIIRAERMYRDHRQIPLVLKRDLVSRTCLTVPTTAIVLVRAFGIGNLGDNLLWVTFTGGLFVISVGTYAFFEVFVIEHPRYYERLQPDLTNDQMDRMEAALARNEEKLDTDLALNHIIHAQVKANFTQGEEREVTADRVEVTVDATADKVSDIHDATVDNGGAA